MISQTSPTPEDLKKAIKEAMRETLAEKRDLLRDVLIEALEDLGMAAAIREGLQTPPADRKDVVSALKDAS